MMRFNALRLFCVTLLTFLALSGCGSHKAKVCKDYNDCGACSWCDKGTCTQCEAGDACATLECITTVEPPAAVLINELAINAAGDDTASLTTIFAELYGPAGQSLEGFVLVGVRRDGTSYGEFTLDGQSLDGNGMLVIAHPNGEAALLALAGMTSPNVDYEDGPGSVQLRFLGVVVDAVGYGAFEAGDVFAGEGRPAAQPGEGQSLTRDAAHADTGDNLVDFLVAGVVNQSPADPITPEDPTDPVPGQEYRIAWISRSVDNMVFWAGREGAFLKARELTDAGPDKVTIVYDTTAPINATAAAQLPVLRAAINAKVDGIGISVSDATALSTDINRAVAAGIKVMTWDSDAPGSDRFTNLATNNTEGGRLAARVLAEALVAKGKTSGKLAVISGSILAANFNDRVSGFRNEIPVINTQLGTTFEANVENVYYCNEDAELHAEILEAAMGGLATQDNDGNGNHKSVSLVTDLTGWFFAGAWVLFVEQPSVPLWKDGADDNVLTVAFDTLPAELGYMRDGYVRALIGQKYWGWGYDTVQMIYNAIKGTATYDPTSTDLGIEVICTEDGRSVMSQRWATYDFTPTLPACDLL